MKSTPCNPDLATEGLREVRVGSDLDTDRVGESRVLIPCQKRRCDEDNENDEFYPPKTRALLLRPPKTTKMAGVTQARHGLPKASYFFSPKRNIMKKRLGAHFQPGVSSLVFVCQGLLSP